MLPFTGCKRVRPVEPLIASCTVINLYDGLPVRRRGLPAPHDDAGCSMWSPHSRLGRIASVVPANAGRITAARWTRKSVVRLRTVVDGNASTDWEVRRTAEDGRRWQCFDGNASTDWEVRRTAEDASHSATD
jgi:hypothetical protein